MAATKLLGSERKPRPAKEQPGGLCSSSEQAPGCSLPAEPARPVQQCEEYVGERAPARPEASGARDAGPEPTARAGEDSCAEQASSQVYRGLCVSCESRFDCEIPKPEGGIWRCEEYR